MFKEKYNMQLNEYEKFWERKNSKRCILNFSYKKEDDVPYAKARNLEQQWLDEKYILNRFRHVVNNNTGYIAEGIPLLFTNLGPGCLAACIGGKYELAPNTIWFDKEPLIVNWETPPTVEFDENSEMWQNIVRLQSEFLTDPDVHFSVTDLGGIMDVVAALRSTEELLCDLYDYPDEVKRLSERVKELWFKSYDKQLEIVKKADQPYNTWMNIPSSKPWYPLQCDFAYMISPQHFEEFVLQDIIDQVNYMERSIYHLDGVGQLPHLDMLLDIPGLDGIQWVPGSGQEPLCDKKWFDIYKKIQDKNKNIVLSYGIIENDLDGVERLIKSINPEGVYISAWFSSREKAEDMVEKIIKWS